MWSAMLIIIFNSMCVLFLTSKWIVLPGELHTPGFSIGFRVWGGGKIWKVGCPTAYGSMRSHDLTPPPMSRGRRHICCTGKKRINTNSKQWWTDWNRPEVSPFSYKNSDPVKKYSHYTWPKSTRPKSSTNNKCSPETLHKQLSWFPWSWRDGFVPILLRG